MSLHHAVIITAAGSSTRFNSGLSGNTKKEFINFEGHSILYHSLRPFFETEGLSCVAVTYKKGTQEVVIKALEELYIQKNIPIFLVEGGKSRQESVFNALCELKKHKEEIKFDFVSIHDGARPFVTKSIIENCLGYARIFGGAVPSVAVRDSLAKVDEEGFVSERVDRTNVYQIQTPQTFDFDKIMEAHLFAYEHNLDYFTDDTAVFSSKGYRAVAVRGDAANRKITYPEDLGIKEDAPEEETAEITGCTGNCSTCHGSCIKEFE